MSPRRSFWLGFADGVPFIVVVTPFAMLFGLVAVEAGLNLWQVLGFSLAVFAGSAQFTALQLIQDEAPTLIVIATALVVNLRVGMYSAAMTPWLAGARMRTRAVMAYLIVDQSYACSIRRYEENPDWAVAARVAYFFGTILPVYPTWLAGTLVGGLVGAALPEWLALDFALPICFLAIVAPMLRTFAHMVAAFTSVVLALAFSWMPFGLGLLVAAVLAMAAGAVTEVQVERRTNRSVV
ncbi:AzlC family ABC transporter permease [Ponticoccus sp. SC2-23]|uniref:AzlC family ABC transporter permease n=1 Tax=Alexandriicola marinus TaxID=2081710 RepID=UPI000FD9D71C|nr:AzlC family ABC transporter permease [Alexandriicola marinus]MBM1220366.1 AzlC family ABC transporter permease [Ponticoccus sp. SC6-9]MBM1225052.1 AzlC family ABC transporter permease [Ponticoccus sp. SC6-15]MBM1228566.1 AzlC family ABC transporter permease [Ponticoccus sp. SC6-38]MBM1233797.1 AzlC family ABC transporter permease [Ponticoccus sp. SC6-45]MBM1239067.1 AzlC family ABC transporter permease [Ponticoccus sp. SC6-49]MBM1242849.1 AzlC family ABC transporter permease [Ponticoccus s